MRPRGVRYDNLSGGSDAQAERWSLLQRHPENLPVAGLFPWITEMIREIASAYATTDESVNRGPRLWPPERTPVQRS